MKGASTEKIIEIVEQCPTDALTFTREKNPNKNIKNKEEKIEIKEDIVPPAKIQILKNGPALISGNFTISDINGSKLAQANNVALCRCGKSSTMPFCDGTHNKTGFQETR
ncbi:MAG: CDGSH iron-sulfur domain-containing protein [Bacteroidales bacterium]|nr:CDGSH iron-sulfur domain-containing protein [Bacteroidales bacterium]